MKKLFIFSIVLLCAISSYSQDTLRLSDALRLGLANNFDILIESGNVEVARLNNNWGETGLFPTITADVAASRNQFDNREAINPFSLLGKTNTTQIQPQVRLNWDLLSLKNISISKRRLEQLQAESNGNASIVVANTIQSIILGYYVAVLERERLNQFGEQLDLSRDKYERLVIKKDIGSAITSDLLLEEGNYLTDSTNYVNQELQYKNSISNLNFLLGIQEPAPAYALSDSLSLDIRDLDLEELIQEMESGNVDLKRQYLTQSVLGYDTQLRKWDRVPALNIGANYAFTRNDQSVNGERFLNDGSTEDFQISGNNENINWGVNFTVSFTLFNGGRINRAIQRAELQENIGEIRVDRLKASLRRDLKQALDRYNVRKDLYYISHRRAEAAKQNLDISNDKFSTGSIDSFDYRTVQNNYLIAAIQRLQSIYDLIDSRVELMRLTGGLIREYSQ